MSDDRKNAFRWLGFGVLALALVWVCIGTLRAISAMARSECAEYIAAYTGGGYTKFSCAERYGCVQYLGREILEEHQ